MNHAIQSNETLSVEQANILDKYLVAVPGYTTSAVIRRKFEQMARELSMLGYEVGYITGWNEGSDYNDRGDVYERGWASGYVFGLEKVAAARQCDCGVCCQAELWVNDRKEAKAWRVNPTSTSTLSSHTIAPTPSAPPTLAGNSQEPQERSTATGAIGAGLSSGSREDRMRLVTNLSRLNDWEIQPLLFLSERLLKGQREYGSDRKYRDWRLDIAEEAADIVAYFAWERYERENP